MVIAAVHRAAGWRVAPGGGLRGALAAPWIFEVPFDLITLSRTRHATDRGLYRVLLSAALVLTGVTTVILLSLVPVVRVRREQKPHAMIISLPTRSPEARPGIGCCADVWW